MLNAKISGIASYVPDDILDNEMLSKMVDTNDEWITTRVGIKERRVLKEPGAGSSYLGTKAVEKLLDEAYITANKNTIPNDPKSAFVTSGIRLGTPAVTSRGMNAQDMDEIAEAIAVIIKGGEEKIPEARAIVQKLTDKYPLI